MIYLSKEEINKSLRIKTLNSYNNMKARCTNINANGYHNYGGRGIKVCEHWFVSFEHFLEDMGLRQPGMTLDRINNDGDYTRWATWIEQANNRTKPGQRAKANIERFKKWAKKSRDLWGEDI